MFLLSSLSLSEEGNARVFSSCAAVLIVLVREIFTFFGKEYNGVLHAMHVFLAYLILDTFLRNTKLPKDAAFHHLAGIFIVGFGLYKMYKNIIFHPYVTNYLNMELTTPLLHGAWILHNERKVMNKGLAKTVFVLLLFMWIPFRLYYPSRTTIDLFYNFKTDYPILESEKYIGAPFFTAFCILQYFWFVKLLERLFSSSSTDLKTDLKTNVRTNVRTDVLKDRKS